MKSLPEFNPTDIPDIKSVPLFPNIALIDPNTVEKQSCKSLRQRTLKRSGLRRMTSRVKEEKRRLGERRTGPSGRRGGTRRGVEGEVEVVEEEEEEEVEEEVEEEEEE